MSAKPEVGFVKEASRQILAGGSAGKAAPLGASRFSFRVSENFSQTTLATEVSRLIAARQAQRLSPPSARAKEAGSGRREPGALGQVRAAALGCPAFWVFSLKSELGSSKACNLEEALMSSWLFHLKRSSLRQN